MVSPTRIDAHASKRAGLKPATRASHGIVHSTRPRSGMPASAAPAPGRDNSPLLHPMQSRRCCCPTWLSVCRILMSGSRVRHEHSPACILAALRGRLAPPAVCCPLLSFICTLHFSTFLAMLPRVCSFLFIPLWLLASAGLLPSSLASPPCPPPAARYLQPSFTPLYQYFTQFCIHFTLSVCN